MTEKCLLLGGIPLKDIIKKVSLYDIITFDIFDTLITRLVLEPTDVFKIVEKISIEKNNYGLGFAKHRIKVEKLCYKKYGNRTSLEIIYNEIKIFGYSEEQVRELKCLEEHVELKVTIPRNYIKELFYEIKASGKQIIFCSDMYLSSNFIRKLLDKCGYSNDIKIIVSNEINLAKHDGSLWKYFSKEYQGNKILHIGDNKNSDKIQAEKYNHTAILINNPYDSFVNSKIYTYLSKYTSKNVESSLILGYLINKILYNSPNENYLLKTENIASIWMGPVLGSFIEWLVDNKDESCLLFVTREGYTLKPLYELFCQTIGEKPQKNILFYASRAVTSAATVVNDDNLYDMLKIEYRGTLGELLRERFNYILSNDDLNSEQRIELPNDLHKVKNLLKTIKNKIYENNKTQNIAYKKYINDSLSIFGKKNLVLSVVDIGYNGTIQYNLSKIMNNKISGRYLFLNRNPLPSRLGCICRGMCHTVEKNHPVYENLLFLEGFLQVPYGQLIKISLDSDNSVKFEFNDDINNSELLRNSQKAVAEFIKWGAEWKKELHSENFFDIDMAEIIWICLIKFDYLPKELINQFFLKDDFAGNSKWVYDHNSKTWRAGENVFPLNFTIIDDSIVSRIKLLVKLKVKKYIPNCFYETARKIWIKYIK